MLLLLLSSSISSGWWSSENPQGPNGSAREEDPIGQFEPIVYDSQLEPGDFNAVTATQQTLIDAGVAKE
ncbi:Uncharacterized protein APZ42_002425 [Daphnia magna]|uniref:Uncharacterized protein n=1 Tax=Daphnia magna TaxID=35525 RepID=A0A164I9R7_9CRUS|nr:Uncharacterized protein APZ42_002425 [Daphnia magna]